MKGTEEWEGREQKGENEGNENDNEGDRRKIMKERSYIRRVQDERKIRRKNRWKTRD